MEDMRNGWRRESINKITTERKIVKGKQCNRLQFLNKVNLQSLLNYGFISVCENTILFHIAFLPFPLYNYPISQQTDQDSTILRIEKIGFNKQLMLVNFLSWQVTKNPFEGSYFILCPTKSKRVKYKTNDNFCY